MQGKELFCCIALLLQWPFLTVQLHSIHWGQCPEQVTRRCVYHKVSLVGCDPLCIQSRTQYTAVKNSACTTLRQHLADRWLYSLSWWLSVSVSLERRAILLQTAERLSTSEVHQKRRVMLCSSICMMSVSFSASCSAFMLAMRQPLER
jgi:hypothetical protein